MSAESIALLDLVVIATVWIVLPIAPAYFTYRITPDQVLGLKGPFQGMTLNATGSFVAYVVVAMLLSVFTWPVGRFLIGKLTAESTWVITGNAQLFDADGKFLEPSQGPDLSKAYLRVFPDENVIGTNLLLKVPIRDVETKPQIYVEVPDWGGARISLNDPADYEPNELKRTIQLKYKVQIRQRPQVAQSVGER